MKMLNLSYGFFCFLIFLLISTTSFAGRTTRDLVFEDDESTTSVVSEKAKKELGTDTLSVASVKTTLKLTRNDQVSSVLPTHEFKSGDKVKILYTVNMDSYVYWLSQGSSGNFMMLFPNPKTGTDNFAKKNEIYTIPTKGSLLFDQTAGTEKILLVMSAQKIPELEQAALESSVAGMAVQNSTGKVNQISKQQETRRATRDLVFEEDEDVETGVAIQSQASTNKTDPLIVYYELKHN